MFPRLHIPMLPRRLNNPACWSGMSVSFSQLHGVSVCVCQLLSCVPCVAPWTVPTTAPSVHAFFFFFNFPGQECWSGLRFLLPGIFLAREAMPGSWHLLQLGSQVPHHWHHHSVLQSFSFQDEALPTATSDLSGWSVMHFCLGTIVPLSGFK